MTCKTCRFWSDGECNRADTVCQDFSGREADGIVARDPRHLFVNTTVADDTNLDVRLRTGPDFGCVLHEPKA